MKRRIAILMHENENEGTLGRYVITLLAEHWREDGHEVVFLFGVSRFAPADLVIVHVNLSIVPDVYLEFARRYPIAINGRVKDIRKSTFSTNIVRPNDGYDGKVIVKSDLNYAGAPERFLTPPSPRSWVSRMRQRYRTARSLQFDSPVDYRIYDHSRQVPRRYFERKDLLVQKFLPEIDHGLYCVRNFHFLGDRMSCGRLKSTRPIVNGSTFQSLERIEPHPDIVAMRERLAFDYGKFDYVVADGKAHLLDVNKTVGSGGLSDDPGMRALRRERAEGLYAYFR
jgi:hypothetical protein